MRGEDRIYFVSDYADQVFFHGGIGYKDIENILLKNKAIPIAFPHHFNFSIWAKIVRVSYFVKTYISIKPGSIVVFQHPLFAGMTKLLVQVLRYKKRVRIICLVADIDGLKDGNDSLLKKEMEYFRLYKYFILHNPNMQAWLHSFHPASTSTLLQCFDFLTKNKVYNRIKTNTIVFAGNLNKSRFLEILHTWINKSQLQINLYGSSITDAMLQAENVRYKGVFNPYFLPDMIEGSFGLIWDGDGLDKPSGSLGNYMQYISHHKLSLYIVCNLPVIVHETAGSAQLVEQLNIGFTVKSLFDIELRIDGLSENEYEAMVRNTRELATEITSGRCLEKALTTLIENMK